MVDKRLTDLMDRLRLPNDRGQRYELWMEISDACWLIAWAHQYDPVVKAIFKRPETVACHVRDRQLGVVYTAVRAGPRKVACRILGPDGKPAR